MNTETVNQEQALDALAREISQSSAMTYIGARAELGRAMEHPTTRAILIRGPVRLPTLETARLLLALGVDQVVLLTESPRLAGVTVAYPSSQLMVGHNLMPASIRISDITEPVHFVHDMHLDQKWKPGRPRLPYFLRVKNNRHQDAKRSSRKRSRK
jgi:hypothetical protein